MNAIEMLKQDHQEVLTMIDRIQTSDKGDTQATHQIFGQLKDALTLHTQMEEQLLYPILEDHDETRDLIKESYREHDQVDRVLAEMSRLNPGNDEFMNKLVELRQSITHHVEEEENELLPKAQRILTPSRFQEMGEQMQQMKRGISATTTTRPK